MKFNRLANNLNIELIKGSKKTILSIAEYVRNGKNLKIKPNDSNLKDKCIADSNELPFGIWSSCS